MPLVVLDCGKYVLEIVYFVLPFCSMGTEHNNHYSLLVNISKMFEMGCWMDSSECETILSSEFGLSIYG